MEDWFVRMALNLAITDDQALTMARALGSVYVDRERGSTEISVYVSAASVRQAVSEGLEQANAAAVKAGADAVVVAVEAKSERERINELANEGIPEVVGVAEIQEILKVNTRQQVGQLAERSDFPAPVAELRAGRIWLRSDIEAFGKQWRRRAGRTAA